MRLKPEDPFILLSFLIDWRVGLAALIFYFVGFNRGLQG